MEILSYSVPNYLLEIALVGLLFYCYMRYKHTYWKRRGIRSVPSHWLLGSLKGLLLMRKSPGELFGDLHQLGTEKDDVLGIYIFHKPFLLLRNPELIKQILIKDFHVFSDRYFAPRTKHNKNGGTNLFNLQNPEWKYLRTKMSPVFTSGKLKKLFNLIVETSDYLKEHLQDEFMGGPDTKEIMVRDILMKYSTDIIANLAFGIRANSFHGSEFYDRSTEGFKITLFRGIRFFFLFFFPNVTKYISGHILGSEVDYFRKVFWDSMASREASKLKRGDVIDSLVELKNQKHDDFEFDDETFLAQSTIFFIAGRETSITTMTFALVELAKHPDIQRKVREEICEKIKEHGMTYEAVQEMKYLNQVISEVLRLYPPAPLIDRIALADYKIPGTDIVIEKGTPVYVALRGIHYDPKYFPNPEQFDPDRFSDERKKDIPQCTYMPFGEGPRICIGLRVGQLQTAMGLITVIRNYEVIPHPMYKCEADPRNVFTSPTPGFKLNFKKLY